MTGSTLFITEENKFTLNNPFDRFENMGLKLELISEEIIKDYNLR